MFKKGDTVWLIESCWDKDAVGVQYVRKGIVIAADGVRCVVEPFRIFSIKDIGKSVFGTPADAERKLRNK